jgi:hypothetical protein
MKSLDPGFFPGAFPVKLLRNVFPYPPASKNALSFRNTYEPLIFFRFESVIAILTIQRWGHY